MPRNEWARLDSNQRPRDYESPALTAELRAREGLLLLYQAIEGHSISGLRRQRAQRLFDTYLDTLAVEE